MSTKISIVTAFPALYEPFIATSLLKKATEKGLISCDIQSLTSFAEPKERIDAPPYGHGAGMLIKPTVVERAVTAQETKYGTAFKVFFSPHGTKMTQPVLATLAAEIAQKKHLMVLPARYEGMDARVEEQYADAILSVGDYVLMGGDLPAMIFLEGVLRLMPGIVGKESSVEHDSFSNAYVDYPSYTEPVVWQGKEVPAVLRSGDHGAVDRWRHAQAVERTVFDHFEWLRGSALNATQKKEVEAIMPPHYAALMHCDVLVSAEKTVGTTSVTSLDIHDIARSARTYGIKEYYIVTPLSDQQKVVQKLLDFWHHGPGRPYNPNRFEAVNQVFIQESLDAAVARIKAQTGQEPLIVATSAVATPHRGLITYHDQHEVWRHKRPVLFIFGTGRGLAPHIVERADYLLVPLEGMTPFNHLSVRSAAAIIFDRWLGLDKR
jgi:tRNA (guanine37-N1)-methyltransferase